MIDGDGNSEDILESNVGRLLSAHRPDACIAGDVKERIASVLVDRVEGTDRTSKQTKQRRLTPFQSRAAKMAAVAAAALIVTPIVLWFLWPQRTIAWTDVASCVGESHTMRAQFVEEERAATEGEGDWRPIKRGQVFKKDPGLSRVEEHSLPVAEPTTSQPRTDLPSTIWIIKEHANASVSIQLYPRSQTARRATYPRQTPMDDTPMRVTALWESIADITADDTRTIGRRYQDGVRLIGFEAPLEDVWTSWPFDGTARIWVDDRTAMPALMEMEFCEGEGVLHKSTCSEIEWDVPLSDELFELPDLEGWTFTDYVMTEVDFLHDALRGGVRFRVQAQDGATLLTEEDIAAVPGGGMITKLKDDQKTVRTRIELRLTDKAKNTLEAFIAAHVGEKLIIDFDGAVQEITIIGRGTLTRVRRVDVSPLVETLEEFEALYLTESDPQANP
jgi:hypothetical protein